MNSFLGLGSSEKRYGQYLCHELESGILGLLSVGADPDTPSAPFKGDPNEPNEDGFLILADPATLLLAIADSHFGHTASHEVLSRLAQRCARLPRGRGELALMLLGITEPAWEDNSATTLQVTVLDRKKRQGFCYNWGDSSLLIVGESGVRSVNSADDLYVCGGMAPNIENAFFPFTLAPNEVLLAFTDGVNECHYRSPQTSISVDHIYHLFRSCPQDPKRFACSLMERALTGVDGNPGGQDNIAIALAVG